MLDAGDPDRKAKTAQIYDVGTQARIIDFDQADNGLLGIVAQGAEKFTVLGTDVARDGLMRARVRLLSEPAQPLPEKYETMVDVLQDLLAHPLIQELNPQVDLREDRSVVIGWPTPPSRPRPSVAIGTVLSGGAIGGAAGNHQTIDRLNHWTRRVGFLPQGCWARSRNVPIMKP